jgi:hypothetical protein
MTNPDKLIVSDEPGFLSMLTKSIENLGKFVEDENKELPNSQQLTGAQKYSRFAYLFQLTYKIADWFFHFPEKADIVFYKLPELVADIVNKLHDFNTFIHKPKVA